MDTIGHFHEQGWMRVPRAFSPGAAAAVREGVRAEAVLRRYEPSTWTVERPAHLQRLKAQAIFREVGGPAVIAAIDAILGGRAYEAPKTWGAPFIAFPGPQAWGVPVGGWHIDAKYTSALTPPGGVKTLALFGDVAPRGGGTQIVSGSHRLVHDWFARNPPPPTARSAEMRRRLQAHPYIRDLHAE